MMVFMLLNIMPILTKFMSENLITCFKKSNQPFWETYLIVKRI